MSEKQDFFTLFPFMKYILILFYFLLIPFFGFIYSLIFIIFLYFIFSIWFDDSKETYKKFLYSLLLFLLFSFIFITFYFIPLFLEEESNQYSNESFSKENYNKTYENKEYNFSFIYPSNWYEDSFSDENVIYQIISNDDLSSITVKKYYTDFSNQKDFLLYNNESYFKDLFSKSKNVNFVNISKTNISGYETFEIIYDETYPLQGENVTFRLLSVIFIRPNNTMLQFNYISTPEDFDTHFSEGKQILESIKFN